MAKGGRLDAVDEIKRLYYTTTRSTILRDLDRAIDLVKTLPTEAERDRVAVYMAGLADMRKEWQPSPGASGRARTTPRRR